LDIQRCSCSLCNSQGTRASARTLAGGGPSSGWRAGNEIGGRGVDSRSTRSWPGHHVVAGPNSLRTEERKRRASSALKNASVLPDKSPKAHASDQLDVHILYGWVDSLERR